MVFGQTFYRHIRLISYVVLFYSLTAFLVYQRVGLSILSPQLIKITYVAFFIDILPTILLHLQYTYFSMGKEGQVNQDSRTITYFYRNINYSYTFDDIDKVICRSSYGRRTYVLSFTGYAYCVVVFKDGRTLVIPNLIFPDVTDVLPGLLKIEPVRKFAVFAFILNDAS